MGLFNNFPYSNMHDLNIDYIIRKVDELYTRGETLYAELESWKTDTNADLAAWKTQTLADITAWETALTSSIDAWKTATIADFDAQFDDFETQLTSYVAVFEGIKSVAETSAAAAAAWATGEGTTDPGSGSTPGTENNAKYFSDRAAITSAQALNETSELYTFQGEEYTELITWESSHQIRYAPGASNNGSSMGVSGYLASDFIPTTGIESIRFTAVNCSSNRACMAWYDANQACIESVQRVDSDAGYVFVTLMVPENAAYMRFTKISDANPFFRLYLNPAMETSIPDQVKANASNIASLNGRMTTAESNIASAASRITSAETDIDALENATTELYTFEGENYTASITWESSHQIRYAPGASNNGSSMGVSGFSASDFIPTAGVESIRFTAVNCSSNRACMAWYDANQACIESVQRVDSDAGYVFVTLMVPENAAYMRFTKKSGSSPVFRLFINPAIETSIPDAINSLKTRVSTAETDIINLQHGAFCDKTASRLDMYIPSSDGAHLINYSLVYSTNESTHMDGWRLSDVWLCNPDKTHVAQLCTNGEWEMALHIRRTDADAESGSTEVGWIGLANHGNELQTEVTIFIDGVSIDPASTFTGRPFFNVQLVNTLNMLYPLDSTAIVGVHRRIDTIDAWTKKVTVDNYVKFTQNLPNVNDFMQAAYLFMCPIRRGTAPTNITEMFIDNEDYILTDCSTTTFSPSDANHGVGEAKDNVTEYKFWGGVYNLFGYAKFLRHKAPNTNTFSSHIANEGAYNKIYATMVHRGETVAAGTEWFLTSEALIDCNYTE